MRALRMSYKMERIHDGTHEPKSSENTLIHCNSCALETEEPRASGGPQLDSHSWNRVHYKLTVGWQAKKNAIESLHMVQCNEVAEPTLLLIASIKSLALYS
jgi:hypothetical protein